MIVKPFSAAIIAAAWIAMVTGLWAVSAPSRAEVLDSSDTGFTIEHARTVALDPDATWARLIEPDAWWHPDHTWSTDAANLSLEARAGGCFCEALPGGGSNEHLRVVHAAPGRLLRLDGRLGPLQPLPLAGVMSWQLAEDDSGGTTVTLRYVVAGPPGSTLENWAAPVDSVLGQQIDRLADLGIGAE